MAHRRIDMTYAQDEALKLEGLAKTDLQDHTLVTSNALLQEVMSIPNAQLSLVQRELQNIGKVTDPNFPEIYIKTREGQAASMLPDGRSHIDITEVPRSLI